MILFDIKDSENHPNYKKLEYQNLARQLLFLYSIIPAAIETNQLFITQTIIKALNFHAIACLHPYAGEYRNCEVIIKNSSHRPPSHYRVNSLMDDFVDNINRYWGELEPIALSAIVLSRLNQIHPFINGNGRTARACCYYALCLKIGGFLKGKVILPMLLEMNRPQYIAALQDADKGNINTLIDLITNLLNIQMKS